MTGIKTVRERIDEAKQDLKEQLGIKNNPESCEQIYFVISCLADEAKSSVFYEDDPESDVFVGLAAAAELGMRGAPHHPIPDVTASVGLESAMGAILRAVVSMAPMILLHGPASEIVNLDCIYEFSLRAIEIIEGRRCEKN